MRAPFPTHCLNRKPATGGYSPTFFARGKVRNFLVCGAVGGLYMAHARSVCFVVPQVFNNNQGQLP